MTQASRILASLTQNKPAPKAEAKVEWIEIDPSTLNANATAAYAKLRSANEAAALARKAFEACLTAEIDPAAGEKVIFGYRFGKLSLAIAPDDAKPSASRKAISLADFKAK